jgi:hypothetical protein
MNWETFRTDLVSFGRLLRYPTPAGADSKLARELLQGKPVVSSVGVRPETLVLVTVWRLACWSRSITLLIAPEQDACDFFILAHNMLVQAEEDLRERIWFVPAGRGMTCAHSDIMGVVRCHSGVLGLTLDQKIKEPLTVLVPNVDRVAGPHLKYLSRWTSRPGTTVLFNAPKRGMVV